MKSVLLAASSCLFLANTTNAKIEIPTDFNEYKEWLDTAPYADKKEHFEAMSEKFIEQHGEDSNQVRLCVNLDQNWTGMSNWVDQKWRKTGLRFLDDKRYSDWVVNPRPGDKPWILMFAYTPYYMGPVNQPTDNMMRNLACLQKVYGKRINFGFMDFRKSEKVFENYDVVLDYGKVTPALIAFDQGKVYPAKGNTLSAQSLATFVEHYQDECQLCPQSIMEPRGELTMYLQYAKFELANSAQYADSYNWLLEQTNTTFVHEKILHPYFGPKVGKKQIGSRLIFWVFLPSLALLWELFWFIWKVICGKKDEKTATKPATTTTTTTTTTTAAADTKAPAAETSPSKKKVREKLE